MSSEYYTLERAAEVLGLPTAEVNRLREKGNLRAFRDGSSWKFRKVEIDDMLAEIIKSRNKQQNIADDHDDHTEQDAIGDDDFELLSGDELVELPSEEDVKNMDAFDSAMENGIEIEDELIDVPTTQDEVASDVKSDLTEADKNIAQSSVKSVDLIVESDKESDDGLTFSLSQNNDEEFSLADDDLVLVDDQLASDSLVPVAAGGNDPAQPKDDDLVFADDELSLAADDGLTLEDDLTLAEDSDSGIGGLSLDKRTGKLADSDSANNIGKASVEDELDNELSKSFADGGDLVGLPVDVAPVAEDDILFEIEDSNEASEKPAAKENVVFEAASDDDDFLELIEGDNSTDFIAAGIDGGENFQLTPEGFVTEESSESTSQFIPIDENPISAPFDGGMPPDSPSSPFQPQKIDFTPAPPATSGVSYQQEVQYTPFMVGSFIAASVLLILPCVMLLDVVSNIWGWNESIPVNSPILNLIGDFIGIKK
ncbi:MAG: helix-turn-helix domain-containing protein [Planctomycetaceae bacterium]|jgi:excisionase family DNA binding protein|nr:helix-turn-helix domain-containing protein [Planctomycetaceae bacterium]